MVDLHHVVGLSLIAIALLRTRSQPSMSWLILAAVLVLVAPWLRGAQLGTPILAAPLTPSILPAPNVVSAVAPGRASAPRSRARRSADAFSGARRSSDSACSWPAAS